jgi:hypothetical protein
VPLTFYYSASRPLLVIPGGALSPPFSLPKTNSRCHMGISLKPQHLNRYRQIAWLLAKYGRSDLVKQTGLESTLEAERPMPPKEAAKADELAADLESLGPTFVKLGQLLSTRVELLPRLISTRFRVYRAKSTRSVSARSRRLSRRNSASGYRRHLPTSNPHRWRRPRWDRYIWHDCETVEPWP